MRFTPPVADLTSPAVQGKLDARLFKSVHDGKPNTAMGAWREALSDDEIWDALAYVRTGSRTNWRHGQRAPMRSMLCWVTLGLGLARRALENPYG
jgi:mono/diheme cytochrome c family protein